MNERSAEIIRLWNLNVTAQDIGKKLGVTRNTIIGVTGNEAGPDQWFSLLLSGSVCPTHWMPLPEPPALGGSQNEMVR